MSIKPMTMFKINLSDENYNEIFADLMTRSPINHISEHDIKICKMSYEILNLNLAAERMERINKARKWKSAIRRRRR